VEAAHAHRRVHVDPAALRRERHAEVPHDGGRLHAGGPDHHACVNALAGRERCRLVVHSLEAGTGADLDTAAAQLARGELG
jgi:hypothetical protein